MDRGMLAAAAICGLIAAQTGSEEKLVVASGTIDLVVLAKQKPKTLIVSGAMCSVDPPGKPRAVKDIALLSVQRSSVRACSAKPPRKKGKKRKRTCTVAKQMEIRCDQPV